jgi:O-antigen/teichoic acid export membrane protein
MDIIGISVFFAIPMAATIPVAAVLCRYRVARNRRISYGTMFAAASCIPLLLAVVATCIDPSMWWSREGKNVPEIWFVMLMFLVGMCVLPALCVLVYYQRRPKRETE